jgi:twitching motility protein PilT
VRVCWISRSAADSEGAYRLKAVGLAADNECVDLNGLLRRAVELGATDVHLKVGQPPILRLDGDLAPLEECRELDDGDLESALKIVGTRVPERLEQFKEVGDLDVAYQDEGLPRFRVSAFRQRGAVSLAFRVIPDRIPTFEDLMMPPGVEKLASEFRGLILVTGATGCGKTTTLAAMIDYMNARRKQHIITIEDPIEILHPDRNCIVNQREIGLDTENFEGALRRALRQDPDTILIGELRDMETAHTALQAAESGHLVLSTLHTVDAAETVGRLIEFFPPEKQQVVRSILAGVLRGVISQRLLPRVGSGRIAAVEVMVNNSRIADLIREGRADEISDAVEEGEFFKMQTFTQALIEHVLAGRIDRDTAANAATNRHDFLVALEHAEKQRRAEDAAAARSAAERRPPDHALRGADPDGEAAPTLRRVERDGSDADAAAEDGALGGGLRIAASE